MKIEPSWRIDYGPPGGDKDVSEKQLDAYLEVETLKKTGVLIPDTRLQAIADAWSNYRKPVDKQDGRDWFDELMHLLDALTVETDDD